MKMKIAQALNVAAMLMLAGCGYDRFDPPSHEPVDAPAVNIDIAMLRSYYRGSPSVVTDNLVIRGSVTTSDKAGNFYRSFVIQDATGAIEVRAGLYDSHNNYPAGQVVTVKLKGLAIGMESGILQTGAKAATSSYYPTEYIGTAALVMQYVTRTGQNSPVTPRSLPISSLQASLCGLLVSVPGLNFAGVTGTAGVPGDAPVAWGMPSSDPKIPPLTGYRKFKNAAGDSLLVVTSGYATFAASRIPRQSMTVTGILMYDKAAGTNGRQMYMLKISSLGDLDL